MRSGLPDRRNTNHDISSSGLYVDRIKEVAGQQHAIITSMSFADLYPQLSPEELKVVECNFNRYIELAFEITAESNQKHAMEYRENKS